MEGVLVVINMLGNTIENLKAQLEQQAARIAELEAAQPPAPPPSD